MKLLITGATGFVGKALTQVAPQTGHQLSALVRSESEILPSSVKQIVVGDFAELANRLDSRLRGNDKVVLGNHENIAISSGAEKSQDAFIPPGTSQAGHTERLIAAMHNVDVLIHTAARAHVMHEHHEDPAAIYQLMNVTLTERLAEVAAQAGVKRFVFLSSIKVNGESTSSTATPIPAFPHQGGRSNSSFLTPHGGEGWHEGAGKPFTETDTPNPQDHYGISKWQAEKKLIEIGQRTGMEIVILRPPLIYGPGVKGNFASLFKLIDKGIPLPFGAINNKRSLLALDNLVSAIMLATEHPAAANQTFLIADDEVVSTTKLLKRIAAAQGKNARLLPVPVNWMSAAAKLVGKQSVAERLFGSLQVDTTKIRDLLSWSPVIDMVSQLKKIPPIRKSG